LTDCAIQNKMIEGGGEFSVSLGTTLNTRPQTTTQTTFHAARLSSVLLPVVAFGAGFGLLFSWTSLEVSTQLAGYLSLAVLAGIDSVLGGVRAGMEGKFHSDVFLSGFVVNTVITVALAGFGDVIGLDLYLVAVLVLGQRMFLNISLIRRFLIERGRASRVALELALGSERGSALTPPPDVGPDPLPGTDIVGA
jgi:small basic protein